METNLAYRDAPILVTGASGFIGTHLCRRLSQLGAEVIGTYLNNRPSKEHAEWQRLDLTNQDAVANAINRIRPSLIFHLASHVEGRRELAAVQPTFVNNLTSTIHVLTAAQNTGCCERLVITNSQEEPEPGDPNAVPSSPYAAAKFAASAYARMFHSLYGLPVVIARVFMVYGPGQRDVRKLVPYTILKALEERAPELSSGMRNIDWVYVSDVVDGLIQLSHTPGLAGQTIDLGSGRFHNVRTVVEEIIKQTNPSIQARFGAIADRAMEQERLANADETKKKINWQAGVTLEEGLARTIEWYRSCHCR